METLVTSTQVGTDGPDLWIKLSVPCFEVVSNILKKIWLGALRSEWQRIKIVVGYVPGWKIHQTMLMGILIIQVYLRVGQSVSIDTDTT